jgi:hypothetical protein
MGPRGLCEGFLAGEGKGSGILRYALNDKERWHSEVTTVGSRGDLLRVRFHYASHRVRFHYASHDDGSPWAAICRSCGGLLS